MDGCLDASGCLAAPFELMTLFSRLDEKGSKGLLLFFLGVVLFIGILAFVFNPPQQTPQPQPPPPQEKQTLREKITEAAKERAKKALDNALHPQPETKPVAPVAPIAPIDSTTTPRWRDRAKDWFRDRLNEDYEDRHSEKTKRQ